MTEAATAPTAPETAHETHADDAPSPPEATAHSDSAAPAVPAEAKEEGPPGWHRTHHERTGLPEGAKVDQTKQRDGSVVTRVGHVPTGHVITTTPKRRRVHTVGGSPAPAVVSPKRPAIPPADAARSRPSDRISRFTPTRTLPGR